MFIRIIIRNRTMGVRIRTISLDLIMKFKPVSDIIGIFQHSNDITLSYSYFKTSAGLDNAVLIACQEIVPTAMSKMIQADFRYSVHLTGAK